jgi:elongation of very long chain fatty acids protein 6
MTSYRPMALLADGRNYSWEMSSVFVDYWWFFYGAALLYLPAVYYGQRFMESRKPVQGLSWVMFLWNISLSAISLLMLYRCFATGYVTNLFTQYTWFEAICMNRHVGLDRGFSWTYNWMGYTKVLELLDTLFLVVRKKHVMTLHWFHHATVLAFVTSAHIFGKV